MKIKKTIFSEFSLSRLFTKLQNYQCILYETVCKLTSIFLALLALCEPFLGALREGHPARPLHPEFGRFYLAAAHSGLKFRKSIIRY